ncbi:MAG: ATP12 family protein [Phreatobacter sp.]|nr:ATP12 family protein [Phreatobacter sp.]
MSKSVFEDWFARDMDPAAYDPVAAARLAMKPSYPKRFYKEATAGPSADGWRLLLDDRPAKTPGRNPLAFPTEALASVVAAEWDGLGEFIEPLRMPITRIANSIIDGVLPDPAPVAAEIVRYASSDLLCYRADGPRTLVEQQSAAWDPVLDWVRDGLGARLILSEGVMFVAQPQAALDAIAAALPAGDGWRLGATHVVTTLTGSALLAIALLHGRLDASEVWTTAHVDEDFQISQWGGDAEAAERRVARRREFDAAATVLATV